MRTRNARLGLSIAISTVLVAAACTSSGGGSGGGGGGQPTSTAAATWDAGGGSDWQKVLKQGRQEGTVTVGGPSFLGDPLAKAFQKDTGIKLQWVTGDGGELSARFDTEARAHHVTMDLLFGGGNELDTLLPEGLLQPIKPQMILPSVQDGKQWREGHRHWYDTDGQYLFQGTTYVFGFITVNGDKVDPASITNWNDLLDPKYKGKIAAYDPTTNGPGQGAIGAMAAVLGMNYLKKLLVDQDVKFYQDNDQLAQVVARGTYPIGLALIQQEIEKYQQEGINLKTVEPPPMPGYLTSGFGVIREAKGAPHPAAAQVFINWYASAAGQQAYQDVMLESSNRLDVNKSNLPPYTVPKPGVKYFDADLTQKFYLGERKTDINKIIALLGGR